MMISTAVLPVTAEAAVGMTVTALMMVLTPGPNMMYLASRSIGQGRRAGLVSLVGTGAGFVIHMLIASFGLAIVFVAVPWLFIGFKAAGVAYLAWLTWQTLRPSGTGVFDIAALPRDSDWRLFRMGLITNLLNPKVAIMYLSVIPQFVDTARGGELVQSITLGLVQIGVSMTVNALIVIGAGWIAAVLARRATWSVWQRRITGTLLGVVTLVLAREVPARAQL